MLGVFALDNKWATDLLNFFFLTAGRKKLWHLSNLNRRVQIDLGNAVRLRLRHLIGGAVIYRVENASGEARIDAATGVLTPVRVGTVSVIAAKAGDDEFNDAASAPFVLTITPATPAGAPQYTRITKYGKTPALTLAGSTLQPQLHHPGGSGQRRQHLSGWGDQRPGGRESDLRYRAGGRISHPARPGRRRKYRRGGRLYV